MNTKSEIITIAKAEFMEKGFQEASMRKIAAKVNEVIPDEEPIWPDDEDEMAKILGLA